MFRIYAFFRQPKNLMEHSNVFTKPFKLDLVLGTVLLLIAIGTVAEFSEFQKAGLPRFLLKFARACEWAVSNVARQGSKSIRY